MAYVPGVVNIYLLWSDVWATLSTFVHLSRTFLSMDFLTEYRIGVVTMDLFYIIFTY